MGKNIRTKDKNLEVHLFDQGMVEVESKACQDLGIEITRVGAGANSVGDAIAPPGALYQISTYISKPNAKSHPFEHVTIYAGKDGIMWEELLSRLSRSPAYGQTVRQIVDKNSQDKS